MKERSKNILHNSIFVFVAWFIFLIIIDFHETSYLYKGGSIEKFRLDLTFPFHWSFIMLLISIPIMSILELINIKNWVRVLIAILLTFVIAIIYFFATFSITF